MRQIGLGDDAAQVTQAMQTVSAWPQAAQDVVKQGVSQTGIDSRIQTAISAVQQVAETGSVSTEQFIAVSALVATQFGGPVAGAIVGGGAALVMLLGQAVKAVLQILGVPMAHGSIDNDQYCGAVDITKVNSGEAHIPYGPDDPAWKKLPLFPEDITDSRCDPALWSKMEYPYNDDAYALMQSCATLMWDIHGDHSKYPDGGPGALLVQLYGEWENAKPGGFPKFVYSLLLQNAEMSWNCSPAAIDPQDLVLQAVQVWNAAHGSQQTVTYLYRDATPNPDPKGWSTLWQPYLFKAMSGYMSVPLRPALQKIVVNSGPPVQNLAVLSKPRVLRALGVTDAAATSTTKKVVTGVIVTSVVAAAATGIYAYITHQTMAAVARKALHTVDPRRLLPHGGRKRNPLPSALGPTTAGRHLAYRVQLGTPGVHILMNPNGTATYFQHGVSMTHFRPTTYQLPKLRRGSGEVLIFTDQIA